MLRTIRLQLVKVIDRFPRLAWMLRSWFNFIFREKELHLIRRISQFGYSSVIGIDIGANTGVYSYFMSKFCTLILSFEPNRILRPYWNNNYAPRLLPIMAAVGSSSQDITLYSPKFEDPNATIHGLSSVISQNVMYEDASVVQETVPQIMLNELDALMRVMSPNLVIVKIDVEGYELEVLHGADCIIKNYEPMFIIEIETKHNPRYAEVFELFANSGYSSFYYDQNQLEECSEDLCGNQSTNKKVSRCINNYIFLKLDNDIHAALVKTINGSAQKK